MNLMDESKDTNCFKAESSRQNKSVNYAHTDRGRHSRQKVSGIPSLS